MAPYFSPSSLNRRRHSSSRRALGEEFRGSFTAADSAERSMSRRALGEEFRGSFTVVDPAEKPVSLMCGAASVEDHVAGSVYFLDMEQD